jgi:hypothetical protein
MPATKHGAFYKWGDSGPKFSIKKLGEAKARKLAETLGKFIVTRSQNKKK